MGMTERIVYLGGEYVPEADASLRGAAEPYLHVYAVVHEHWHIEDWHQTRQTLGLPPPPPPSADEPLVLDVRGGRFAPTAATSGSSMRSARVGARPTRRT